MQTVGEIALVVVIVAIAVVAPVVCLVVVVLRFRDDRSRIEVHVMTGFPQSCSIIRTHRSSTQNGNLGTFLRIFIVIIGSIVCCFAERPGGGGGGR